MRVFGLLDSLTYIYHIMKTQKNTTGSERWDISIIQKQMTQKTVPSKKLYKRKPRTQKELY